MAWAAVKCLMLEGFFRATCFHRCWIIGYKVVHFLFLCPQMQISLAINLLLTTLVLLLFYPSRKKICQPGVVRPCFFCIHLKAQWSFFPPAGTVGRKVKAVGKEFPSNTVPPCSVGSCFHSSTQRTKALPLAAWIRMPGLCDTLSPRALSSSVHSHFPRTLGSTVSVWQ